MNQNILTVKGMFIKANLDSLKSKANQEQKNQIEKEIGNIEIAPFKEYPIELQNKIEKIGTRIVFGSNSDEAYRHLGETSFSTFANSMVGKTIFSLMKKDPKKLTLAMDKLWKTMTNGLTVVSKELGDNSISVRMSNNPYPPTGIQGIYESGLKFLGKKGKVSVLNHGGKDYEYILEWES